MSFYVYLHRKKTTNEIFYVGKGSGDRAWSTTGRSDLWTRTIKKYGYTVEIVLDNLQEWYAFELEKELIALYGRLSDGRGKLVNLTDGGEGLSGEDHPMHDKRLWTFANIDTGQEVITTKSGFRKAQPNVSVGSLFYGLSSSHGWYVKELLTEDRLAALLSGYSGEHNSFADKKEYEFVNLKTGEIFKTTRHKIAEKSEGINFTGLISRNLKSSKGWTLKESFDLYGAEQLLNYSAGRLNGRADLTKYSFKNMLTEEVFSGTRFDFKENFGFDPADLFTERLNYVVKDWCLAEKYDLALENSQFDYKKYRLIHPELGTFVGTKKEFKKKFGHHIKPLFGAKPAKFCKGWYLVQENLQ